MTFMEWIRQYEGQNNRYGDLAGDIQADHRFPMVDNYHTINNHLKYMSACSGAHETFNDAWRQYEREAAVYG